MKTKILLLLIIPVALVILIYSYTQMSREKEEDQAADQPVMAASRVQHNADGSVSIDLDASSQQLIGLQTTTLAKVKLSPEVKGFGRVLDSATLVSLENEMVATQSTLQVSKKEYERQRTLSSQNNTSAEALELAEAKMKRDKGALDTAEAQLVAASSQALLDQPPSFFENLLHQKSVLVRLDLPAGESLNTTPVKARLELPGKNQLVTAEYLGRAAVTDAQVQGAGFLVLATNAPAVLTPGLAITGFLQMPGNSLDGVMVPDDAVVRSDERAWIYVQARATNFVRHEIILNHPAVDGWFVTNNTLSGTKVVITGAQMLLSEERKGEIKLED